MPSSLDHRLPRSVALPPRPRPLPSRPRQVRQFFKQCGAVAFVDMPVFEDTGKSRGVAHVTFTRKASAQRALELSGEYWGQKYLEVLPHHGETDRWRPLPLCSTVCATRIVATQCTIGLRAAAARWGPHLRRRYGFPSLQCF